MLRKVRMPYFFLAQKAGTQKRNLRDRLEEYFKVFKNEERIRKNLFWLHLNGASYESIREKALLMNLEIDKKEEFVKTMLRLNMYDEDKRLLVVKGVLNHNIASKEAKRLLKKYSSKAYDDTTRVSSLLATYALFGKIKALKTALKITKERIIKEENYSIFDEVWEVVKRNEKIRDILTLFFGIGLYREAGEIRNMKDLSLSKIMSVDIEEWLRKEGLNKLSSKEMKVVYRVLHPFPFEFKFKFVGREDFSFWLNLLSVVISSIETSGVTSVSWLSFLLAGKGSPGEALENLLCFLAFNLINLNIIGNISYLKWKLKERKFIKGQIDIGE